MHSRGVVVKRPSIRSIVLAASVALATTGCGDATSPDDFAGSYRLERYEGLQLPALVSKTSFGTVSIIDEQLFLSDNGEGVALTTFREVNQVMPQGKLHDFTRRLDYVLRGSRIEITYECPPNANCIAGPHAVGELVNGGLSLAAPTSSKPASIYTRSDRP